MANPPALAQYAAMGVLDALCKLKPPRMRGSDTVLCVNSGTPDACTPRIVVKHFQIAASCETQNSPPTLVAQCGTQNWHEQRCDPETRHGQCVVNWAFCGFPLKTTAFSPMDEPIAETLPLRWGRRLLCSGMSPQFDPHQPATRAGWQETYKSSKNANKRSPACNAPAIALNARCCVTLLAALSLLDCVGFANFVIDEKK